MLKSVVRLEALCFALLLASCAQEKKDIKPYRGTLVQTVQVEEKLAAKLNKDHGFNAALNCVQMVERDQVQNGIRSVEKLVIFSPDACPADPKAVADREAFAVHYTESPAVKKNQVSVAFHLVKNSANSRDNVGEISSIPASTKPANPNDEGKTENKASSYQLTVLCSKSPYDCGLRFTNDGRFSQIDPNRAAVARMMREQALHDELKTHMELMRNDLSGQLNQAQNALVANIDNQVRILDATLRNENKTQARYMTNHLVAQLIQLEGNLNQTGNSAHQNSVAELRQHLQKMEAKLTAEVRASTVKVLAALLEAKQELDGSIKASQKAILNRLAQRMNKLERKLKSLDAKLTERLNSLDKKISETEAAILDNLQFEIDMLGLAVFFDIKDAQKALSGQLSQEIQDLLAQYKTHLAKSLNEMKRNLDAKTDQSVKETKDALEKGFKSSNAATEKARKDILDLVDDLIADHADESKFSRETLATLTKALQVIKADGKAQNDGAIQAIEGLKKHIEQKLKLLESTREHKQNSEKVIP